MVEQDLTAIGPDDWCERLNDAYGDLTASVVSIADSRATDGSLRAANAWEQFTDCTGVRVRAVADHSDIVVIDTFGLAPAVNEQGAFPLPDLAASTLAEYWSPEWTEFGTLDGVLYATPGAAGFKSLLWYSPSVFAQNGWAVPTTWAELAAIADATVAAGGKPLCVGLESGAATGWPASDWWEDIILRQAGPDAYEQWVSGELPSSDPIIAGTLATLGGILKNPNYVNAGWGDVSSVATTSWNASGLLVADGTCTLHHQASFYEFNYLDLGSEIGPDADVFAFYLPTMSDDFGKVAAVSTDQFVALSDSPGVQAAITFTTTSAFVNAAAEDGAFVSAHSDLDPAGTTPFQQMLIGHLQDPDLVPHLDGSDRMPPSVGTAVLWAELVKWVSGQDDATTLAAIDAAWPNS